MRGKALAKREARQIAPFSFADVDKVFERMREMSDAIARRAFEIFESNGRMFGRDWEDWFKAEEEILHPVHITVSESDEALEVQAEVPGFSAKELGVSVEPHRLTIAGKRESKEERKKGKAIYSERCADEILRVIDLPAEVDASKVTATLKDGILEFGMPKALPSKKVRIEPKAA